MALTDASVIQGIVNNLGVAWAACQSELNPSDSSSIYGCAANIRTTITNNILDSDYVNGDALALTAHQAVAKLPGVLDGLLAPIAHGLDNYYIAQTGQTFRAYWANVNSSSSSGSGGSDTVTWTSDFLNFWRNIMNQELVSRLGYITNSAGAWGTFTQDQTIELNQALGVKCITTTTRDITLTITLSFANTSLANIIQSVIIPNNTTAGTVIPIPGGEYQSVVSVTATGGEDGDNIEIWVATP